jgi:hypothetical protein
MEHRFGRTLRVFLVVLAAAGFYRLAVVPWVEPRVKDLGSTIELSPEQVAAIRARADKRLAALGDIFPEGSWERDDPIMLESRQMRLLFKQYHSLPDGRVNLVPCTLVILPDRNRTATDNAGSRTLVLRAPQGAVLEFDEPLDLRQGRLAKLIGGSLRGQVAIRGTATAPDAEDDIEIATRDVELADLEIRTGELVQFRYGRSTGSGRALVARLLPRSEAGGGKDDRGPNIGGIDSIRLDRDVRMRLEGLAGGLLPGQEPKPAPPAAGPAANQAAAPQAAAAPVHVNCRGSLCLNVSANVITFEDHVDVVRTGTGGASDQLACELLAIRLARGEAAPAEAPAQSTTPAQPATGAQPSAGAQPGGGLRPVEIQARGTPVVARSTASGLEARGTRLGYEIATRRILLDGDEPVSLVVQGTEMEARSIDYCPGPNGDPGALMAVGPGWLKARSPGSPPVQARWQKWLRMRPDGTGHVASISGEADVTIEAQGRLSASEMHLWLEVERQPQPAPPTNRPGPRLDGVKPSRLLARGMVEIDTEELTARTDRMELWFKHLAAAPVAATAAPQPGLPGAVAPAPAQPGVRPAEQGMPHRGKLVATGGLVRGLVSMSPDGNQLEEISLENQVHLIEQPRSGSGLPAGVAPEPAIEIKGDQLQLSRATRFDARAVVSGRPAQVMGRGLDLEGPLVEFDRGRNRLTVDGAGRLRLPMADGMNGLESLGMTGAVAPPQQPPPVAQGQAAEKLDVTWQGRMDFDGLTARFVDRVVTASGATSLKAGSLDVIFNQPIDFSAGGLDRGGRRADVAKIACGSGVRIESESIGQDGSKSVEKLFVRDLVLDRATGDVAGSGPGRLTSSRFGQAPAMAMPGGVQPVNPAPQPATRPDEITYLGVDFQRGMRGNIHRRMMEFHQRVEAIWGPVAGWEDALDAHAPGGLPPRAIAITSEVLGVGQAPPAPGQRRSSIELMAGGNVLVEGESFTARSARLSWSEAKDLLVFEGDGRSDAQLFRQMKIGAPTSSASAGKILYWRALNRVDVDDARYLDLDQFGAGGNGMRLPGGLGGSTPAQPISQPVPGT